MYIMLYRKTGSDLLSRVFCFVYVPMGLQHQENLFKAILASAWLGKGKLYFGRVSFLMVSIDVLLDQPFQLPDELPFILGTGSWPHQMQQVSSLMQERPTSDL